MLYVNLQTSSCHYHSVPDESAYTVQCHVCTCHGLNNNIRYSISKINVHIPAIIIIIIIAAVLLSYIQRTIEPKDQSHDQTSHHKSSDNGGNVQVGSNHSLPLGNCDSSNCCILLTLDERYLYI